MGAMVCLNVFSMFSGVTLRGSKNTNTAALGIRLVIHDFNVSTNECTTPGYVYWNS